MKTSLKQLVKLLTGHDLEDPALERKEEELQTDLDQDKEEGESAEHKAKVLGKADLSKSSVFGQMSENFAPEAESEDEEDKTEYRKPSIFRNKIRITLDKG